MRGETRACKATLCDTSFQSTPLMRGETKNRVLTLDEIRISIHSPHARGDLAVSGIGSSKSNFNPLPSCEGRPTRARKSSTPREFQSTPLMRGETACGVMPPFLRIISIHSPHARGDCSPRPPAKTTTTFQSTPLMRGETQGRNGRNRTARFQSTPLMRGETQTAARGLCARPHFNPLPSCEGRQHKPLKIRLDSRQFIQQKHHSSFF